VGDAVLLLRFSFWVSKLAFMETLKGMRFLLLRVSLVAISVTKRAQAPFTRWLPAAIAAPTPVSALVHRSTLVTAGVWLIIRFRYFSLIRSCFWLFLGFITLLVASLGALSEIDGKKIVALSTLRQLGLMYVALFIGGVFITLLHLLTHALAKANLFLMVGSIIHRRFSQQDIRLMTFSEGRVLYFAISVIRVFRLSGLLFFSGFFSKDLILLASSGLFSRVFRLCIFIGIISLTLVYCLKLMIFLLETKTRNFFKKTIELSSFLPRWFLRALSLFSGFFLVYNFILQKLYRSSFVGGLWKFLLLTLVFLAVSNRDKFKRLFNSQLLVVWILSKCFSKGSKKLVLIITRTFLERFYLTSSLRRLTFIWFSYRASFILVRASLILFFL
jgi:NADH:ubiquinone oxidoreductase subunit 5 (subunit L)/multisubunit Na+/H+ antiporter MnhA subunit